MCLARAYVHPVSTDAEGELVMENVTRVEVQGDRVRLTSLLGEVEELQAQIRSVSFADSRLVLESPR